MYTIHYQAFIESVNKGIFDNHINGNYFRDISIRAKHLQSPIESDKSIEAFGLSEDEFYDIINSFLDRASVHRKVLPLDHLVCVEDEFSAVFAENHPSVEKAMILTSFINIKKTQGFDFLSYGVLNFIGHDGEYNKFAGSELFASYVFEDHHAPLDKDQMEIIGHDLVNSASTVIEQLAYMEKIGLITETRKMLH